MSGGIRVAVATCVLRVSAAAETTYEWRDGCPAGNRPDYPGTISHWHGATPQTDSALMPSHVMAGSQLSYYTAHNVQGDGTEFTGTIPRLRLWTPYLQAHQNFRLGKRSPHSLALTATLPYGRQFDGDRKVDGNGRIPPSPDLLGNPTVALSYRRHKLYGYFDRQDEENRDVDDAVAGMRIAWAARVATSFPRSDRHDDRLSLALAHPFDAHWFGPAGILGLPGPLAAAFELRAESVGCYAPFVHIRLSVSVQSEAGDRVLYLPQTAAVGMYVSSQTALLFQYGVMIRTSNADDTQQSLFGIDAVHRFRFGGEHTRDAWRLGANIDLFRGSQRLEGVIIGAYFLLNWDKG